MFLEIRFPEDISFGAIGGPNFNTNIEQTAAGYEARFINWLEPKIYYNVSHGIKTKDQIDQIISFFYVTQGRANGFRFKDWMDYKIPKQVISKAPSSGMQIYKNYTFNQQTFKRPIKKIVPNTEIVYSNDIPLESTQYTIDYNNGLLVTEEGGEISIECEFDIPVRFASDDLKIGLDNPGIYVAKNIILHEIIE
ncbi:DUF2460 domain-containing protein [Anaplasmataceae bacterium AB001_6]|nr:DUF2460 domain-containing protein [Anaplasmataceae bacterium AB001_6]